MKLIFFDIDGTIIDSAMKMPESTKRAIEQARANGHVCVINTGRTWKMVDGLVTQFTEFDGYVLGCGTMVRLHDETILKETFSPKKSQRIIDSLRKYGIEAVLEGSENDYIEDEDKMHTPGFRAFADSFKGMGFGSFDEAVGHFDKLYAYTEDLAALEGFCGEWGKELDIVDRGHGYYEMMPRGFDKASGMRFLADRLGISMEDTVAIGDSSNDLPMLKAAHISIAMGNAPQTVKEAADYVTDHVNENGIENALKWLGVLE